MGMSLVPGPGGASTEVRALITPPSGVDAAALEAKLAAAHWLGSSVAAAAGSVPGVTASTLGLQVLGGNVVVGRLKPPPVGHSLLSLGGSPKRHQRPDEADGSDDIAPDPDDGNDADDVAQAAVARALAAETGKNQKQENMALKIKTLAKGAVHQAMEEEKMAASGTLLRHADLDRDAGYSACPELPKLEMKMKADMAAMEMKMCAERVKGVEKMAEMQIKNAADAAKGLLKDAGKAAEKKQEELLGAVNGAKDAAESALKGALSFGGGGKGRKKKGGKGKGQKKKKKKKK